VNRKKIVLECIVVLSLLFMLIAIVKSSITLASSCKADINGDGRVDYKDAEILKAEEGRDNCIMVPCQADLNSDGKVDSKDRKILKAEFFREDCSSIVEEDSSLTTRFKDNKDGTITDSKTGLMWTKDANLPGDTMLFHQALKYIEEMNEGKHPNFGYTDWRLSNLRELRSLLDYTNYTLEGHALTPRYPFENLWPLIKSGSQIDIIYLSNTDFPTISSLYCRLVGHNVFSCYGYVWPVRGGK